LGSSHGVGYFGGYTIKGLQVLVVCVVGSAMNLITVLVESFIFLMLAGMALVVARSRQQTELHQQRDEMYDDSLPIDLRDREQTIPNPKCHKVS